MAMLIVKRKENATKTRFSFLLSLDILKFWGVTIMIPKQPMDAKNVCRAVRSHGNWNYRSQSCVGSVSVKQLYLS